MTDSPFDVHPATFPGRLRAGVAVHFSAHDVEAWLARYVKARGRNAKNVCARVHTTRPLKYSSRHPRLESRADTLEPTGYGVLTEVVVVYGDDVRQYCGDILGMCGCGPLVPRGAARTHAHSMYPLDKPQPPACWTASIFAAQTPRARTRTTADFAVRHVQLALSGLRSRGGATNKLTA